MSRERNDLENATTRTHCSELKPMLHLCHQTSLPEAACVACQRKEEVMKFMMTTGVV